ncbi:MAG: type I 3-dehydroquinate dehydratase [Thermoplasmataceae archaeon]
MPLIEAAPVMIGKIKIGGEKATVVTSIFSKSSVSLLNELQRGIYNPDFLYEIRYDLFKQTSVEELRSIFEYLQKRRLNFIFTYRAAGSPLMKELYQLAIDMQAPAIDIDVSSFTGVELESFGGTVILSTHDFQGARVSHMLRAMLKLGGNIFKLASSYASSNAFLLDMFDLYTMKEELKVPLAFIPMGERNSALRLFSGYFLSDIVYARAGQKTAEGQLTRSDYERFFRKF